MHYQKERNHQGAGNRLLEQPDKARSLHDPVRRRQRLGSLLNYYYREAA